LPVGSAIEFLPVPGLRAQETVLSSCKYQAFGGLQASGSGPGVRAAGV